MTRHVVLGNQSLLINIDNQLRIRDIYYPFVGLENHLAGHSQRVGIFTDGRLSWVDEPEWEKKPGYKNNSLVSSCEAANGKMGVSLRFEDNVCESDIFVRRVTVKNMRGYEREIRIFFNQDFHLYGDGIGDTAVYQMERNVVIHYKRSRYFLTGALKFPERADIRSDVDDFAVGHADSPYFQGTFRDAEDGMLSKNPAAQGTVDSTLGLTLQIPAWSSWTVYYYMTAGTGFEAVFELNDFLLSNGPEALLEKAETSQRDWLNRMEFDFAGLNDKIAGLLKRSVLVIKTQMDKHGAILAANDSDIMQYNKDTYSYMWPRDGAFVAMGMIDCGYAEMTRPFFRFCRDVMWEKGCLLHKYNPDRTLGSSWHPWVENGHPALPLQEDETALVLIALWRYFEKSHDMALVSELYEPMVKQMAYFLDEYRYPNSIPMDSYDLWEERRGVFTFTSSAVYGGLKAAEKLGMLFNDLEFCKRCVESYNVLHNAILNELYDPDRGIFLRGLRYEQFDLEKKHVDYTADSSVFGLLEFGVLPGEDSRLSATFTDIKDRLWIKQGVGGMARYENDSYYRVSMDVPGNPWIVCTLWLAKWHIEKAKSTAELYEAWNLIAWAAECALETGILPEQVHPFNKMSVSVAPLTWSHAEFLRTVLKYQEKKKELEKRDAEPQ